jgi:hypothetical protein
MLGMGSSAINVCINNDNNLKWIPAYAGMTTTATTTTMTTTLNEYPIARL